MKRIIRSFILLTGLLLSISLFAQNTTTLTPKERSALFIQNAESGSLLPVADHPGSYQLTLNHVRDYIGYFSDRPERVSGIYPTTQFLADWVDGTQANSFNKTPPNAALSTVVYHDGAKKMVNLPLQLSKPNYDVKTHTMTYIVQVLPGIKTALPLTHMGQTALFIDNYGFYAG